MFSYFMESQSPRFQPKPEPALREQFARASEAFGGQLAPPGVDPCSLPVSDLLSTYGARWRAYASFLASEGKDNPSPSDVYDLDLHFRRIHMLNALAHAQDEVLEGGRSLRSHQVPVFQKLSEFLEAGGTHGFVTLPTGTGKTIIFSKLLAGLEGKALIVVPTKDLLVQTEKELRRTMPEAAIGVIGGDGSTGFGQDLTIITYDSFRSLSKSGEILEQHFDVVVLDEAHKALGEVTSEEVTRLLGHSFVFGFTATPEYNEQKSLRNLLGEEIYRMEVPEAVEIGALCQAHVVPVVSDISIRDVSTGAGDYNLDELSGAIDVPEQNKRVVSTYQHFFSGQKAVAFCAGIDHAEHLAKEFRENGVAAESISGEDSEEERKRKLLDLAEGRLHVLCNADLLTHGFDDPGVSVCLNCTPTLSTVLATQRAGRVLRLDPDNPEKMAYIVEFLFDDRPRSRLPITFNQILQTTLARTREHVERGIGAPKLLPLPGAPALYGNVRVISDPEEARGFLEQQRAILSAEAPPGWLTTRDLMEELGLTYGVARGAALAYAAKPEWFGVYRYNGKDERKRGKLLEHYHPDLVAAVRYDFSGERPDIYAGWFSVEHFANLAGLGAQPVKDRFINPLIAQNNSWCVTGSSGMTLYSPDLEPIARAMILRAQGPVPSGWIERRALKQQIGVEGDALDRLMDKLLIDNSDWERWYRVDRNYRRHYAPQLVQAIQETLIRWQEEERAHPFREGWEYYRKMLDISSGKLSPYSATNRLLVPIFDELSREFPSEFAIHKRHGRNYPIASPTVMDLVRAHYRYRKLLSEGWRSEEALLLDLPASFHPVARSVIAETGSKETVTIGQRLICLLPPSTCKHILERAGAGYLRD